MSDRFFKRRVDEGRSLRQATTVHDVLRVLRHIEPDLSRSDVADQFLNAADGVVEAGAGSLDSSGVVGSEGVGERVESPDDVGVDEHLTCVVCSLRVHT